MAVGKDFGEAVEKDKRPSIATTLSAQGYGDLRKGRVICQRIAESMARAEIAKQLEVEVERMSVDRVESGQDILWSGILKSRAKNGHTVC